MLLRISAIAICLAIICFSVLRLSSANSASSIFAEFESKSVEELNPSLKVNLDRLIESPFVSFKDAIKVSRIFSALGEAEKNPDQRLHNVCETLAALERAIKLEPFNGRALVTWASVKQLLGNHICLNSQLRSDVLPENNSWESAVDLALKVAPIDQQALFNAALVLYWGDRADKAFPIFQRVLDLSTDTSAVQKEFIYALVKDEKSLTQLIPAKIPHILEFIQFIISPNRADQLNEKLKTAMDQLRVQALKEFSERYRREEINEQIYEQRLSQIWELSRYSKALSVIDKLFFDYYSNTKKFDLSKFFEHRSGLTEIKTLAALRLADSRPQKSALAEWGSQKLIALDNFFTSVGFYLPRNTTLRRIELHSKNNIKEPLKNFIRILASDDNNTWEDFTGSCDISSIHFNSKMIIKIDIPSSNRLFWKINFQNSSREAKFTGSLDTMIRVFGLGGS